MGKKKIGTRKILCDTNIFIEIIKGNETIKQQFEEAKELIAINPIIKAELYAGAGSKKEFLALKKALKLYTNCLLDIDTSKIFEQLIDSFAQSHNLKSPDGLIASTAIAYNLRLWTLNVSDFVFIDEIEFYKP